MRIVAGQAIRRSERLVLVRLLQIGALGIMAIQAERRRRFGQMEIELRLSNLARLVRRVASLAAHVEGGVAAAVLPQILRPNFMAGEAKIIFLVARRRLQQLKLVVRGMRVVALQAVAYRRWMHMAFNLRRVLIGMAAQTNFVRDGGNQCYVGCVFVSPDLMAAQATRRNCRMNELALRFIFVAFEALGRIDVLIQWNRMNRGRGAREQQRNQQKQKKNDNRKRPVAMICDLHAQ